MNSFQLFSAVSVLLLAITLILFASGNSLFRETGILTFIFILVSIVQYLGRNYKSEE